MDTVAIVGCQFHPDAAAYMIEHQNSQNLHRLVFQKERDNPYAPVGKVAVAVYWDDIEKSRYKVGYVANEYLDRVTKLLDENGFVFPLEITYAKFTDKVLQWFELRIA